MSEEQIQDDAENNEEEKRTYDLSQVQDLVDLLREEEDSVIEDNVGTHLEKIIKRAGVEKYLTLFLFDEDNSISDYHANKLYDVASESEGKKDIFLVLHSRGGKIEPAYLISKTCQRLSKKKFSVAIPRRAKSAATLISLGANEVHMGLMSELGPIDPQIGGYPALGLTNALNKLASLATEFPDSSDMFAAYLTKNLSLRDLGYFERVSESAVQYAERLLSNKELPTGRNESSLADHFVNHYKDHGFVIDVDEAQSLLGDKVVKSGTKEYSCANEIFQFFNFFGILLDIFRKQIFTYVGGTHNGLNLKKKEE